MAYPGKYVVMARRKGDRWYIAGIYGENSERTITLHVLSLATNLRAFLSRFIWLKELVKRNINFSQNNKYYYDPYGGFVIKTISGNKLGTNK